MRSPAAFLLAAALLAPAASAQDAPRPERPLDALRSAWEAVKKGQDRVNAAWQAKDRAELEAGQAALRPLQRRFKDLFAAADWDALDPAADREILGSGLLTAGNDALRREDSKTAVRAFETALARLPAEPFAGVVAGRLLPSALLAAGESGRAAELWRKCADGSADPSLAARARISLGDLACARGDLEAARGEWTKAAGVPVKDGKDPAAALAAEATLRLDFVGKPAPGIDSGAWIGREPAPLTRFAGRVVVLDFFATWSGPSRASMPGLHRFWLERRGDGLEVLGITRTYPEGFLPAKGTKDPEEEGERLPMMEGDAFLPHLRRFRENLGILYPFVVADNPDFDNYRIRGFPSRFLVDRRGRIALVRIGTGDEALLRLAAHRLLAEK